MSDSWSSAMVGTTTTGEGRRMSTDSPKRMEMEMPTYRKNAIAAVVMLIVCTAAAILYIVPLGGPLSAPVDLAKLAANENGVVMAALI